MFNKSFSCKEKEDNNKSKELTEEDYDQINQEISKVLSKMKGENQDNNEDEYNDEGDEGVEQNIFCYDFYSENSNPISNDNISDFSDNSFKSANVEMTRNNSLLNMMKNNNKTIDNINNNPSKKEFSLSKNKFCNERNNNLFSSTENIINKNNNFQNNNLNFEKIKFSIQNSPNNMINFNNDNISKNNLLNTTTLINNINQFNNINNANNPNIKIIDQTMIDNLNSINFQNQPFVNNEPNFNNKLNYVINSNPFNNINIINYNNNINNNQIYFNNNNNLFSFPTISERGVPGLYNLDSPKNIINLDNILKSRDKRTTLIIRNIPNKYTISLLLDELNKNFKKKFDIVYLPQDYINNSNLGFGFINFTNYMHLILFYDEFVGKKWNCFNSKKRCQLAYSKYQGRNELIKYILTKLGISSLDNNNENIKKSFFINNNKIMNAQIEIPIKYYSNFISFYPYSLCHNKDDEVFVIDKYYNV